MSHEIWDTDQMFTVREPAWHGLGVVLPDYPTREEAQTLAHPWEPIEETIYLKDINLGDDGNLNEEYVQAPGYKAIRRSDNGNLLGVNGDGYAPVLNSDLWDIAEALEQSGSDVMYETAGSLKGGRKVWVLLKLKDPIVIPGDKSEVLPYFALQNSHDGSSSFRGQGVTTRIVCSNTAALSDIEAKRRGTQFSFRHTKNVDSRIEEARLAVAGWRESIDTYKAISEHLVGVKLTNSEVDEFLERWMPLPRPGVATNRVIENIYDARAEWRSFLHSVTCEGIENTAYGILQASIEYAEWGRRAFTEESRFKRSFLEESDIVRKASTLALELAR